LRQAKAKRKRICLEYDSPSDSSSEREEESREEEELLESDSASPDDKKGELDVEIVDIIDDEEKPTDGYPPTSDFLTEVIPQEVAPNIDAAPETEPV
jgi:hypothetical protein